jgi:hypothetical protein
MKRVIMISAASIVTTTFAACSGSTSGQASSVDTTAKMTTDTTKMVATDTAKISTMDTTKSSMASTVKYTCKMHPEVISDKPGKCPKCGMDLVVKTDAMKTTMSMSHDSTMSK